MDLEKIRRAFKRNRFACSVFSCKEDAASYLVRSISGKTVGMGDYMKNYKKIMMFVM